MTLRYSLATLFAFAVLCLSPQFTARGNGKEDDLRKQLAAAEARALSAEKSLTETIKYRTWATAEINRGRAAQAELSARIARTSQKMAELGFQVGSLDLTVDQVKLQKLMDTVERIEAEDKIVAKRAENEREAMAWKIDYAWKGFFALVLGSVVTAIWSLLRIYVWDPARRSIASHIAAHNQEKLIEKLEAVSVSVTAVKEQTDGLTTELIGKARKEALIEGHDAGIADAAARRSKE